MWQCVICGFEPKRIPEPEPAPYCGKFVCQTCCRVFAERELVVTVGSLKLADNEDIVIKLMVNFDKSILRRFVTTVKERILEKHPTWKGDVFALVPGVEIENVKPAPREMQQMLQTTKFGLLIGSRVVDLT